MSKHTKIRRNDTCYCGSGSKYKKCCLSRDEEPRPLTDIARRDSEDRLKKRLQKNMGGRFTLLEGEPELKMSEVILHIAEELLSIAQTKSQKQQAIAAACVAWNLAVTTEPEERETVLEAFLENSEDDQERQDTCDIIDALIEKKNFYYPEIERLIVDYDLVGNKNDFHLNVASIIPPPVPS